MKVKRIKIFTSKRTDTLEELTNKYIEKLTGYEQVIDIKHNVSNSDYGPIFTIMVTVGE